MDLSMSACPKQRDQNGPVRSNSQPLLARSSSQPSNNATCRISDHPSDGEGQYLDANEEFVESTDVLALEMAGAVHMDEPQKFKNEELITSFAPEHIPKRILRSSNNLNAPATKQLPKAPVLCGTRILRSSKKQNRPGPTAKQLPKAPVVCGTRILRSSTKQNRPGPTAKQLPKALRCDSANTVQRGKRFFWTESMNLKLIDTVMEVKGEQLTSRNIWEQVVARITRLPASYGFKLIMAIDHKRSKLDSGNLKNHRVVKQFYRVLGKYNAALLRTGRKSSVSSSVNPSLTDAVCKKLKMYKDFIDSIAIGPSEENYVYMKRKRSHSETASHSEEEVPAETLYVNEENVSLSKNSRDLSMASPLADHPDRQKSSKRSKSRLDGFQSRQSPTDNLDTNLQVENMEKLFKNVRDEFSQLSQWCKHKLVPIGSNFIMKAIDVRFHDNRRKRSTGSNDHPYKELITDCFLQQLNSKLQLRLQDFKLDVAELFYRTTQEVSKELLETQLQL